MTAGKNLINFHELDIQTLASALAAVVAIFLTAIWYVSRKEKEAIALKESKEEGDEASEAEEVEEEPNETATKQKKAADSKLKVKDSFQHKWLTTTLKGHTAAVTGVRFTPDGKKLMSVSVDRNVFLWKVSDFHAKEHKSYRQVLDFDTATRVSCAPDSKSVVLSMKRDNKLEVFKWIKKDDNGAVKLAKAETVDFPICHQHDIKWLGISATGKFLMSASSDMKVYIYDLKGQILKKLEPKVSTIYDCSVSPDGRFISVCGFTPDVFVFEPLFKSEIGFQDCKKVFDLKGHTSGVFAAAFNGNSSRAATISRDGSWRVFDTDIRYNQGQEASILTTGTWSCLKGAAADKVRVAISPSGGSIAVSFGTTIKFFSTEDYTKDYPEITDVHSSAVEELTFSPCGSYLVSCSDRYIRVFHNVAEHHSTVVRLTKTLPEIHGDGPRRRVAEQIDEAKKKMFEFLA